MYTHYFGFNEKPFTLTPNPRFIFLSRNHREALAHVIYGINNHYGFIELIGEVGSGKTTVLRTVLEQLGESEYRCALIFNNCLTTLELLRSINQEFGLDASSEYAGDLLTELNAFLLHENRQGITVVLVIDEAQNLSPEILEQLRLISNLETEDDKLIQIVLAGQPELARLLALPVLRQLKQRISVRYRLKAMNRDETDGYIRHRMVVAGETGGVSFSRLSLLLIYFYSKGLPRLINNLCDRSLLVGYGYEKRLITVPLVLRAIIELYASVPVRRMGIALFVILFLTIGVFFLVTTNGTVKNGMHTVIDRKSAPAFEHTTTVMSRSAALPAADIRRKQISQELCTIDQETVHHFACNAILRALGAPPVRNYDGHLTVPDLFTRIAEKRNLRVTELNGTLSAAVGGNVPFLVKTTVPGEFGNYCIAVTSHTNKQALIEPPLFGSDKLPLQDLELISSGQYYLVSKKTVPIGSSP